MKRSSGYTSDEVLGQSVNCLMRETEHAAHAEYLKQVGKLEKRVINTNRELFGLRKDGTLFPMELTVSSTELAGEKVFIGVFA